MTAISARCSRQPCPVRLSQKRPDRCPRGGCKRSQGENETNSEEARACFCEYTFGAVMDLVLLHQVLLLRQSYVCPLPTLAKKANRGRVFRRLGRQELEPSLQHRSYPSCSHQPNHFTQDHLRRVELLAIPAAAAIQNARLYSTAEIYGSELEKRLEDLQKAEQALDQSEADRRVSEEKFQNIT